MAAFFMSRYEEATLALLRVMAGLMLMQHGAQKLFGVLTPPDQPARALEAFSRNWFAGILEMVLGPLLVLGLGTRVVAFILSGEMAFAYFLVHAPRGFWPILNRGELASLYCFVFLYFAARGGGRYSLDAVLARRRGEPVAARTVRGE
ncbi:MAG TPA: DoxX family protein [Longimicrobium sp.]|jgi:putative oxidoreductase